VKTKKKIKELQEKLKPFLGNKKDMSENALTNRTTHCNNCGYKTCICKYQKQTKSR
jgi:hypothetical protein